MQFSEDIQVETIEPEPEPVYIDEVRVRPCRESLLHNKMHSVKSAVQIDALFSYQEF